MVRHNLIATYAHRELCWKFEIKMTKIWYEHVPLSDTVTQTGIEILWDVEIKTTTNV